MAIEQKEITTSPWGSGIGCRSHFLLRTASARLERFAMVASIETGQQLEG
jgi:hypothetical protein